MYIKKYPNKKTNDTKVYLFMAVSGSKKARIVEKYDSLNELIEKHGSERAALDFLKARCAELEGDERFRKRGFTSLKINLDERIDLESGGCACSRNAGYLFLQKAYSDLGVESFVNKWKFDSRLKIKYSLNDAFRLLVYSRVEEPCSKLATSCKTSDFIEDFDLTVDDLYDSLGRINSFSKELTRRLSGKCRRLIGGDGRAIFYDCTNFYFEVQSADGEGGLRDYGVEKNHRPDPIVEYGLLMDEDGYPIGSSAFRGNESEKTSLIPLLSSAGEEATKAKIIVADGGLNTEGNKDAIHNSGRSYIFCQSPKQLSAANAERALEDKGWMAYENGRKRIKSLWIKRANGREERLVVRFDQASCDFINHAIDSRVERAERFLKNPSRLNFKNCSDGKQYIEKVAFDGDGEIIKERSVLRLREEDIEKDRRFAGYTCFVTDIPREEDGLDGSFARSRRDGRRAEFMDDIEIAKIAGKRNDIENCFRNMKTGMDGRPIFVRRPEHIEAHLFTVYVALTLLMYVRKRYAPAMTMDGLFGAIRGYSLCRLGEKEDVYKTGFYSKDIDLLAKSMGFDFADSSYLAWERVKKMISLSKNR